jgi:hypothetical protein
MSKLVLEVCRNLVIDGSNVEKKKPVAKTSLSRVWRHFDEFWRQIAWSWIGKGRKSSIFA